MGWVWGTELYLQDLCIPTISDLRGGGVRLCVDTDKVAPGGGANGIRLTLKMATPAFKVESGSLDPWVVLEGTAPQPCCAAKWLRIHIPLYGERPYDF